MRQYKRLLMIYKLNLNFVTKKHGYKKYCQIFKISLYCRYGDRNGTG